LSRDRERRKIVALGFHPVKSSMKYELGYALLIANTLRWMAPDVFRSRRVQAGTVGHGDGPGGKKGTDPGVRSAWLPRIRGRCRSRSKITCCGFFCGAPGTVRVLTESGAGLSLTLPDVGESLWHAPADGPQGIPRAVGNGFFSSTDIWPWFRGLGVLGVAD